MKAQIVIPSYKRVEQLKNKTLAMLRSYNIPDDICKIYVANDDELAAYQQVIEGNYDWQVIGRPGIGYLRNYISKHNKENEWLLWIDDDIEEVQFLQDGKLKRIPNLEIMIDQMVDDAEAVGSGQVGIYPVNNHFFMKNKITKDLRYVINCFCLTKNDRQCEKRDFNLIEDFERTLKYYVKYNCSLRYEFISVKTAYYATGGIEAAHERNVKNKVAEIDEFLKYYGSFAEKKIKTNMVDIKFKKKPEDVIFDFEQWQDQLNIQRH